MNKTTRTPIVIFFFICYWQITYAQFDSTIREVSTKSLLFKFGLCGTFTSQNNWNNENVKNIMFAENIDFNYRITSNSFIKNYQFKNSLGYIKILDSTWIKNVDYWKFNINWSEIQSRRLTHSYSILSSSQLLPTYKYLYNSSNDDYEKKRVASFFNPGKITLAYGLSWSFWNGNFINFNFASVNFYTKPRVSGYYKPIGEEIGNTNQSYLYFEYGFNINSLIYYKINDFIQWENTSYYFMNGVSKNQVHLDFLNRIVFLLWRYIQFRIDTHIIYEPILSYSLQYQNAFTLGLVYEVKKRK